MMSDRDVDDYEDCERKNAFSSHILAYTELDSGNFTHIERRSDDRDHKAKHVQTHHRHSEVFLSRFWRWKSPSPDACP